MKSFRGKETERIWSREYSKCLPRDIQERALMKLQQLNAAGDLRDLSIPSSNQLEALKGDRKGEYNIRINKQWRVCFRWQDGHAFDVEIVDYHWGRLELWLWQRERSSSLTRARFSGRSLWSQSV